MGIHNDNANIDRLIININEDQVLNDLYHIPKDQRIHYPKHEQGYFRMKYPEKFSKFVDRF